jgi:hypothetical protein
MAAIMMSLAAMPTYAQMYTMTALNGLSGGANYGNGINNAGRPVGWPCPPPATRRILLRKAMASAPVGLGPPAGC